MFLTLYSIVAFGVLLSAMLEGESIFWSFVAGVFWPVVLCRMWVIRYNGK